MPRPGIPPSLDRQDRTAVLAVAAVLLAAVFLGLMYLALRAPDPVPVGPGGSAQDGEARLQAYLAEKERASAYAAVRDHLDQRKEEANIVAVYCRDCRHRWVDGRIEFRGDVDFERPGGRLQRHTYVAVLSGSSQRGWEMESVEVQPAR